MPDAPSLFDGALADSWMRPELVELGRLPMRPPLVSFPDAEAARGPRETSPWHRSLDGRWGFQLFDAPEAVPADAADDAGVSRAVEGHGGPLFLPSLWEGFGGGCHAATRGSRFAGAFSFHPPLTPPRGRGIRVYGSRPRCFRYAFMSGSRPR